MNTHMEAKAITVKIGAILLPVGIILFAISTAVFHPSKQDPMNNSAVFMEYAQSGNWVAIHFVQWFAALFLIGGLVSIYYSIGSKPEPGAGVARFGLTSAILTATAFTMLQAVDGVALKWAVDTWSTVPSDQKEAAFFAALSVRWAEYALQSYSNILLGLTLILYGFAIVLGTIYNRWLGWLAGGSGVAWIVHGVMVPYVGFFDSIPRLVAIILLAVWSFIMAFFMWRNNSRENMAAPSRYLKSNSETR